MSKIKIFSIAVLSATLVGAAYAGPGGGGGPPHIGGGAPHPMSGGGGAPHPMAGGGGMPHAMGGGAPAPHFAGAAPHIAGGAPHFGGGPRPGGAPHFSGGGGPRFSGVHAGGAPRFSGSPAISHFAARPNDGGRHAFAGHGGRFARGPESNANRNLRVSGRHDRPSFDASRSANVRPNVRTSAVRSALNSRAVAGALHDSRALRFPNARAQIAATAATAGWHEGRGGHGGGHGWWRHRNGGFGWVGPLFWPFAYYDIYDYTLWGYGYDDPFWDYGYNDIYAGIFSPYGYDDLAGYWPQESAVRGGARVAARAGGSKAAPPEQLAQMCGEDSRDIAGLPIDQIQAAIAPNDLQRAALDDLANASVKAAQDIRAACPTQIALTAPGRLASMQQRIEAMISAVRTVQPPLQKFYDLLSDEQKARLNALGDDQRRTEHREKQERIAYRDLQRRPGKRHRMARRRDRGEGPSDGSATRQSLGAAGCYGKGRGHAEGLVPGRTSRRSRRRPDSRPSASGWTSCCKRSRPCARRWMISMASSATNRRRSSSPSGRAARRRLRMSRALRGRMWLMPATITSATPD